MDLILSSGFLAFARHLGFLRATEHAGIEVDAVCGTSSGALVGALWMAGHDIDTLRRELATTPPVKLLGWSWTPWRGLFALDRVVDRLRELLPATFEELGRPFAAGVMTPERRYELVTSGPLPEAVAASCAIPGVFRPITIDGRALADGGAVDRCGVTAWRAWRSASKTDGLVHWVDATHGTDPDESVMEGLTVVRTPPSGASFFSLRNFDAQLEEAESLTQRHLG